MNTVVLALDNYKITKKADRLLIKANVIFTVIFAIEMVVKILAFGVLGYVRDSFNLFDGILVIISLVGMIIEALSEGGSGGTNVITVFRSIRVLRIFKLASRSQNLLILLEAIRTTVKEIMNYLFLLLLYIFIMALLGMELYAFKVRVDKNGDPIQGDLMEIYQQGDTPLFVPDINFDNFFQAFIAVFCLLVNEDWHIILYQYKRASNITKAYTYIGCVVVLGNFLLL